MQINRTTILRGPALIQYGGQSFWSKGNVTVTPKNSMFSVTTDHFGEVDERYTGRMFDVTFEPSGAFTDDVIPILWPHAETVIGASIYGATDVPLVVWSRDGKKLTLPNAQVTKLPTFRGSVAQTMIGQMTFTGLLKNATDPSNAAAYYTLADATYPVDSGFSATDILTAPYLASWGDWENFATEGGWEVSFDLSLREEAVDGLGVVDMTFQGLTVTAKAVPVGITQAQVLAAMSPAIVLGSSHETQAGDLGITSDGVYVMVKHARVTESGFDYANDRKRIAATAWKGIATVSGGAMGPRFYIGTAAP